jgi:hypothetical protein
MANTLARISAGARNLIALRDRLIKEEQRLRRLLLEVEQALHGSSPGQSAAPQPSPLDEIHELVKATEDLRAANGKLSALAVASAFGISMNQLARWLGRSRQALTKTPDAYSLQNELAFFERVARLRAAVPKDRFLKWLRMPHDLLDGNSPLDLMAKGPRERQVLADFVEDMLTGAPT